MFAKRKLIVFLSTVAFLIIVLAVVWSQLMVPEYNRVLAATTESIDFSGVTFANEGDSITIQSMHGSNLIVLEIDGLSIQYGLVILLALIMATPKLRIYKRSKLIGLAFTSMFVLHILALLVMGRLAQTITPDHPSISDNPAYVFFISMGVDLFPILIGTALLLKHWLRVFKSSPSIDTEMAHHYRSETAIMESIP